MVKDRILKIIDEKGWNASQLIENTGVSKGVAYAIKDAQDIKADDFCKIVIGLKLDAFQLFELVTGNISEKTGNFIIDCLEKRIDVLEKDKSRLLDMLSVLVGKVADLV